MKAPPSVVFAIVLAVCIFALYLAQLRVERPTEPETSKTETTLKDLATCLTLIYLAEQRVASPAQSTTPGTTLTDEELMAYVSCPVDLDQVGQRIELGQINGTLVVADHYCSDLCPSNTVRVVHYELQDGKSCTAAGGVERQITVPMGIGLGQRSFCFPKHVIDHWDVYESGPLLGRAPKLKDVPESGDSEASRMHLDRVTTGPTTEVAEASWQDRVDDVIVKVRSGALTVIRANVKTFESREKAQVFTRTASSNDPQRVATGNRLEAKQTWFYFPGESSDALGPVLIHVITDFSKDVTGMMFELSGGSCEAPGVQRSYHVIVPTTTATRKSHEQVIVARIPPKYLTGREQCGTILEAW